MNKKSRNDINQKNFIEQFLELYRNDSVTTATTKYDQILQMSNF